MSTMSISSMLMGLLALSPIVSGQGFGDSASAYASAAASKAANYVIPVNIAAVEKAFDVVADFSLLVALFVLVLGICQLYAAFSTTCNKAMLSTSSCWKMHPCMGKCIDKQYFVAASFLGLIYLMYIITIPLFGLPQPQEKQGQPQEEQGQPQGEGEKCLDKWLYPRAPHFAPPKADDKLKTKLLRGFVNMLAMCALPYMLLFLMLVIGGALIVTPAVCVLMGLFVLLSRFADKISHDLSDKIQHMSKIFFKAESDGPEVELTALIPAIPGIQVPWWTMPTWKFYLGLKLPGCCPSCSFSCCMKFVCLELPSLLVTIALPGLLKFLLDILFVLTIFRSFAFAFHFNLPFALPKFNLWFFDFDLPTFAFPTWHGNCGATKDLGATFNLAGAAFTASVIITSDILVALFDRQRRAVMLKKGFADAVQAKQQEAAEAGQETEFSICGEVMKKWAMGKINFETGIVGGCSYVIFWVTGQVMNLATVSFAVLVPQLVAWKAEPYDTENQSCTWGMFASVKLLQIYIMICTVVYFFKVLSGKVHKDGIYILSAALVCEETLCQGETLWRLIALMRVCVGQFLLPFLPVGLSARDAHAINEALDKVFLGVSERDGAKGEKMTVEKLKSELGKLVSAFKTEAKQMRNEKQQAAHQKMYLNLKDMFSAKARLIRTLQEMAYDDKKAKEDDHYKAVIGEREQPKLREFQDFRLKEFTARIIKRQKDEEEHGKCGQHCVAVVQSPVTVMGDLHAQAAYVPERCCIWQAQLESVHRATCFEVAFTLLLIPIAGALMCKSAQWLTEAPAVLWSKVKEVSYYSFHWRHTPTEDTVTQGIWCMAAFGFVILRIATAAVALFVDHDQDGTVLLVCSIVASALVCAQNKLMQKDCLAHSCLTAKAIDDAFPHELPKQDQV